MLDEAEIAIIGGYGISKMLDPPLTRKRIDTPYGTSPEVVLGNIAGKQVVAVPRHGKDHHLPPHKINYRANAWTLKILGVRRVLANTAVGSLNPDMKPGDFIILDNLIDFTKTRVSTFYEGEPFGLGHIDVTDPYCPELRKVWHKALNRDNISHHTTGVYVCVEGPRYETRAEIKMFQKFGGDVVGMTQVPEVILARELGICYSNICLITNYGAGISKSPLDHQEVVNLVDSKQEAMITLYRTAIQHIPSKRRCECELLGEKAGKLNQTK